MLIPRIDAASNDLEISPPIVWLLTGWGSWSQRAERVAPGDNVEVTPNTGTIRSHLRIINRYLHQQLQQTGDENDDPPGQYRLVMRGNQTLIGRLLIGWGSWSQRVSGFSPRDDVEVRLFPGRSKVPFPDHEPFQIAAISTPIHRVDTTSQGTESPPPSADR